MIQKIEIPIAGMDCAECTRHVQQAIAALPGIEEVQVFLASEKALVRYDPQRVDLAGIRQAVQSAGYRAADLPDTAAEQGNGLSRQLLTFLAVVFGAVIFVVVLGEWLGLFRQVTAVVPFWIGAVLVLLSGFPIFVNVIKAAFRRQITSHTLMCLGVVAALAVGEWATAAVVVFFMRVGDYAEKMTGAGARRAVKDLTALAPQTARVERDDQEILLPVSEVQAGDTVVVRPGERIPVDGVVLGGQAWIDQSTLTGESMPREIEPGQTVFAASLAQRGSLRIRTLRIGPDTTFGKVIHMVEEAEAQRGPVQRFADRFSAIYLPIVAALAALVFLIRRDPLATAAVLVVACSCSITLATPIAMLASIGSAARRGLLIKGGKYLESLAKADVLLLDKTGTLTSGTPTVTDVLSLDGRPQEEILRLAAALEHDSEHPLAQAVRDAAQDRGIPVEIPQDFESLTGMGVRGRIDEDTYALGSARMTAGAQELPAARALEAQGKTLLFLSCQEKIVGVLAATDTLRPEIPQALDEMHSLGMKNIELLTGDNPQAAAALAHNLGIQFRADLLPEDKIQIVKDYQAKGHTVVMVGDGINDAPALAQADVGIAMGAVGAEIALEAAHVALLREDWLLVPQVFRIAHRTMAVVRANLLFTAFYNMVGLSLAAAGLLPPVLAAAAQSLPDLGIMANSARLLHLKD